SLSVRRSPIADRRSTDRPRSERLLVGSQVELLRPGGSRLDVNLPVHLCDCIDREKTVFPALLYDRGAQRPKALAVDSAIDDHVCDVQALWTKLARHALRD